MVAKAIKPDYALGPHVAPLGLELRAGIHTVEVELRGDDIGGIAVHLAARIAALAHGLRADDLVLCLMSGGASSLLALPGDSLVRRARSR